MQRETDKEGGGGTRRFRRALEAWPGKAVRHSGSDGGGSEPITYYNCLASERSERGAPVRHPSSRRMVSLPITSAVIANFSRPCLLLASSCRCRFCAVSTPNPPLSPSSRSPTTWPTPPPPPPPPPLLVCINFLAEVTSSERELPPSAQSESWRERPPFISARLLNGKAGVIDVNHATRRRYVLVTRNKCHQR